MDPSLHSDDRPSLFAFAFVNVNGEEIADKMMKVSEYIDHVHLGVKAVHVAIFTNSYA